MSSKMNPVRVLTKHGKPGFLAPDGRTLPLVSGGSGPLDPAQPVVDPNQPPVATQEPPAPAEPQGIVVPVEPAPPAPPADDRLFTREDIEKARKEEKDKLYGRLQSLESRLEETERERQERIEAEAEAKRQAEEAERRAAEEEMSARELIQAKEQEWNTRFAEIEAQRAEEQRVFQMEREFQQLEQYRMQALAQHEDQIMPELRDLISGNTPEEVDRSIALAVEKTDRILQQVQAQQQLQRQGQRGVSATAPAAGPLENETNYQTLTADDIRNMDMDTYRQNRERILGALGSQNRSQGLYG